MLTATYTLVALSVEQANVRKSLQSLQKLLHASWIDQAVLTPHQIGHAVDAVRRLYDSHHWRKIDMFLIPAVRSATDQANLLLRDLDELARTAAEALAHAAARMGSAALDTHSSVAQFCNAIDVFCAASLKRLDREEQDLFPVARAVISGETWFSIANKMLAHDAYVQDRKQGRQPALPTRQRHTGEPDPLTVEHATAEHIGH